MPRRSKITQLPPEIKAQFDRLLIEKGFSDYDAVVIWLQDQGFDVSRSTAHRYGQEFEKKIAAIKIATEQARAITDAAGDEEGKMNDALIRLIQQKSFDVLVNLQDNEMNLPKLGTMIARIAGASVQQKKWQSEAREKAKTTADDVVRTVKKSGMSEKTAEEIRKKILGIV
jgi:hypothetical protein